MWQLAAPYSNAIRRTWMAHTRSRSQSQSRGNDQLSPGHAIRGAKAVSRRTCHCSPKRFDWSPLIPRRAGGHSEDPGGFFKTGVCVPEESILKEQVRVSVPCPVGEGSPGGRSKWENVAIDGVGSVTGGRTTRNVLRRESLCLKFCLPTKFPGEPARCIPRG